MKIVLAGGTGQLGNLLSRSFADGGHAVVVLSRGASSVPGARIVPWDGRSIGAWAAELDGADVVINLAGRSVNCRPTEANMRELTSSRIDSTRAVGAAIAQASRPPRLWLQASAATIYAHRFDAPNDEATGLIGGDEPGVPRHWQRSVELAKKWERALAEAATPHTRKVALRTSMVMSPEPDGVFDVLLGLTRRGLGGAIAGGAQFVSWIHGDDFVRAVDFLITRQDLDGAFIMSSPVPLPQREFMAALRQAWGTRVGLPASRWMLQIGAFFLRSDSELVLKSRRVVPGRLLGAGFSFQWPEWPAAARDLVARWKLIRARP